jgi:4-hydroxy-tetrahydrodipicolinate reductase
MHASPIRLIIHGAAGRMGKRLIALSTADEQLTVAAAIDAAEHPQLGSDAGELAGVGKIGVPLTSTLPDGAKADVIIDFSLPEAVTSVLEMSRDHQLPLVLATTGLTADHVEKARAVAAEAPVVWAPNMSPAVNVTMKLAAAAAKALRQAEGGVDVEIVERHHRYKEDSPSGTALKFGELISENLGGLKPVHGRHGRPGARPANELGYHAVRAGDHPGEHTIIFGLLGEAIELKVFATSRDSYAMGALAAAKWLAKQPPGMYGMDDVLGL